MNSEKKTIVVVGRPNVGKTSFFNKFVKKNSNRAIVFKEAGTTIDYKRDYSEIFDSNLIDTPGLSSGMTFSALCNQQTKLAILQADICIFVIDGGVGLLQEDLEYAKFVRRTKKELRTILVANKCDKKAFSDLDLGELKMLGFGEPICISAEQNIGFSEVVEKIYECFKELEINNENASSKEIVLDNEDEILEEGDESEMGAEEQKNIQIDLSIVGRPNVGKSTLLNRLFGDSRAVVSEIAGTTRDSISADIKFDEKTTIRISDTAGIRKNDQDYDNLEKMAVNSTLISIQFANIAALVIDGTAGFERQDLVIGEHVLEEGRGLIVLINKADQVKKKDELLEAIEKISSKYFCGAPVIFISAKNGFNCEHVLKEVIKLHEKWNKRIKTSKLNNWLHDALVEHEHRLAKANRKAVKIKFMSQYDIRPPHFYVNINKLKALDQTYKRYLINSLRKNFGFDGVPIRVEFRESKNPYIENNPHYKNYNKPKK
jgi:GTP-binding protein